MRLERIHLPETSELEPRVTEFEERTIGFCWIDSSRSREGPSDEDTGYGVFCSTRHRVPPYSPQNE